VPAREQTTAPRSAAPAAATKPGTQSGGGNTTGGNPSGGGAAQPKSKTSPSGGGQADGLPPVAPADDLDLQAAPQDGTVRHDTRRPALTAPRTIRSVARNVLFGRVRSRQSDEPEEGVEVLISSRSNSFQDRVALSDAFGRFAVKVPDGDWTVKVTMPSGRVYSVSEITVSNGLITDDGGRAVPSLTITR
jgi:hypothetical protein